MRSAVSEDVRAALIAAGSDPSTRTVADALRTQRRVIDAGGLSTLVQQMRSDLSGFGPLDRLITLPDVTDIIVNGCREVYVDRGRGLEPVDVRFRDDEAVRRMVQRLATSVGRRIDDAHPYVDAPLPGGVRLHAVLPPLSDRVCVSLRLARRDGLSAEELVAAETIARDLVSPLRDLIAAGMTFLVSGGTGSGKTTLLSALLGLINPTKRLVIVEDTSELAPAHPHVIKLQTRASNVEGRGAVSMRELVRQAMRMRPDRLIVGEARGAEIVDLLSALNTGHEGGCGTIHANSATDVPARVEALAIAGGLNREAAHSQLGAALDAVLHLSRRVDGRRFVHHIAVLERDLSGLVRAVPAFEVDAGGSVRQCSGLAQWHRLVNRH
ncbi:MAG TPA: TadA family conjugal transfer-associated ATPase [Actinomycetes bacterium]|nr:TadA family conjugal transfer-associated ATPase [Actinomycetes bacterium]